MQKHILVVFSENQHKEKIAKTLEIILEKLRAHKKKGELKNTWYNIHNSSVEAWRSETMQQAHNIAFIEITGQNREALRGIVLSNDTAKRIAKARERIFRSMI